MNSIDAMVSNVASLQFSPLFFLGCVLVVCEILSLAFARAQIPSAYAPLAAGFCAARFGLVDAAMVSEFEQVMEVAVALALFDIGRKLDLKWAFSGRPLAAWAACAAAVALTTGAASLLLGLSYSESLVIASVSASASPVLFPFMTLDADARGPGCNSAYTFIGLGMLFSIVSATFVKTLLAPPGSPGFDGLGSAAAALAASSAVGACVFVLFHAFKSFAKPVDESSAIVLFGFVSIALAASVILGASPMVALLCFGFLLRLVDRGGGPFKTQLRPAQRMAFSTLLFATAASAPAAALSLQDLAFASSLLCLQAGALYAILRVALPYFNPKTLLVPAAALVSSSAAGFYLVDSSLSAPLWFSSHALAAMSGYISVSFILAPALVALALRFSREARPDVR